MIGDAREHTAQIGLGIEVEHLAGLSNPKDGATRSLPARVEAEEEKPRKIKTCCGCPSLQTGQSTSRPSPLSDSPVSQLVSREASIPGVAGRTLTVPRTHTN
jgi:hypothetical protein